MTHPKRCSHAKSIPAKCALWIAPGSGARDHDWGGALAWWFAAKHPEYLDKLVIINAPHPAVFGKLLASDPDQQKASQYMFMFCSPKAEEKLAANNYALLNSIALDDLLKTGA